MKIPLLDSSGQKVKDLELKDEVFKVKVNPDLIQHGLRYQISHSRKVNTHVKTKGMVSGGGRKPYAQKHTGKARQGSIRNPHYKGGGTVFGPSRNKNFAVNMPRKQRTKALLCALNKKLQDNKVFALEQYDVSSHKTKDFSKFLNSLSIKKSVLFVIDQKIKNLEKSSSNIARVKIILGNYLNIFDLLKFDTVCLLAKVIPDLEKKFMSIKKTVN